MKAKHFLLLLLPAVVLLMTGCPIGLDYSLGTPGTEEINKSLIGTWVNGSEEAEVKRVKIAKGKDNSYEVAVQERGEMYSLETDELQGWVTTVEDKSFIYLKPIGEEKYYHYCYWMDGSTLITCDVSLLDGGVDMVTSTETLRSQVAKSMHKAEWGSEVQEWTKE
ncbi:MAG TPA: hypothetical protein VHS96_11955 [Bacteroidia bacterium]|nr:hypothetical protein [Bacteroidia bacterium]